MLRIWALVFCLSSFILPAAQAIVLLEPYAGYVSGEMSEESIDGFGKGLRLGFHSDMLFGGINGFHANRLDLDKTTRDVQFNSWTFDFGVKFLDYFRAWGGYVMAANADVGATKVKLKDASGYKLGGGVKVYDWISLNVEWVQVDFDDTNPNGALATSKRKFDYVLGSVSLPFEF